MDGSDPLQDEKAEKRRHRDGAAYACLQHDPRHKPHGHSSDDRGDQGVRSLVRLQFSQEKLEFVET